MKLKLLIGVASILGCMALVASAQAPAGAQPRTAAQDILPQLPGRPDVAGYPQHTLWAVTADRAHAEEAQLARVTGDLVRQLAKAEGDKKEDIKSKLTTTLNKQFDLRQKRHESEIAALEAQVNKLKDLVRKRQENRNEIITQRLSQLVRESQGLGW